MKIHKLVFTALFTIIFAWCSNYGEQPSIDGLEFIEKNEEILQQLEWLILNNDIPFTYTKWITYITLKWNKENWFSTEQVPIESLEKGSGLSNIVMLAQEINIDWLSASNQWGFALIPHQNKGLLSSKVICIYSPNELLTGVDWSRNINHLTWNWYLELDYDSWF